MENNDEGKSSEGETLKNIFDDGMKLFQNIDNSNDPTNSSAVQLSIKTAMSKFEKATNLVSLSSMFSRNESIEEIPTECLQYLLLPVLLGCLTLKICNQQRKGIIEVAEIYFRDFLQRCKDYGITDLEAPQRIEQENSIDSRPQSEQTKITNMVMSREAKIKRYQEMKELKEKVIQLKKTMDSDIVDDEVKREYFLTLIKSYVNQSLDEINSIEQEKPILEYLEKHADDKKPSEKRRPAPLKPVIITRDAVQKAVFGLGYPSFPTMTVEEYYDQRVKEGVFPGSCIPHATIQNPEADHDENEEVQRERLVETDDPEELQRQRNMDEYKDDHIRGWGNRHNRS